MEGYRKMEIYRKEFPVGNESQVISLIEELFKFGSTKEMNKVSLCKAVTAISELSTNLIKYANNGKIHVLIFQEKEHEFLMEVISKDEGPGIEDLDLALQDNYSSGNSLGLGLPAIKRLSDEFEISSSPEGTIIKMKKYFKHE